MSVVLPASGWEMIANVRRGEMVLGLVMREWGGVGGDCDESIHPGVRGMRVGGWRGGEGSEPKRQRERREERAAQQIEHPHGGCAVGSAWLLSAKGDEASPVPSHG